MAPPTFPMALQIIPFRTPNAMPAAVSTGVVIPAVICDSNKLGMRCHYYPYLFDESTRTVDASDVAKSGANFLAAFLPKPLHFNLAIDTSNAETDNENHSLTLQDLYEREEERLNAAFVGRYVGTAARGF